MSDPSFGRVASRSAERGRILNVYTLVGWEGAEMETRIQRWGNSLGLRIPKSFAGEIGLEAGSTVDLSVADGDLVVRPARKRKYDVASLSSRINSRNVHTEIETGERAGREAW
jgi:antitoxin MazE